MEIVKEYPNGDRYRIRLVKVEIDNPYTGNLAGHMEPDEILKRTEKRLEAFSPYSPRVLVKPAISFQITLSRYYKYVPINRIFVLLDGFDKYPKDKSTDADMGTWLALAFFAKDLDKPLPELIQEILNDIDWREESDGWSW